MATKVMSPFNVFFGRDGMPLEAGYIYIGSANQNAQVNPIQIYWDEELTIPASQPIRTIGGYPSRSGTPSIVYVQDSDFSITVRDKNGAIVFSSVSSTSLSSLEADLANYTDPAKGAALIGYALGNLNNVAQALDAIRGDYVTPEMFNPNIGAGNPADDTAAWTAALATGKTVKCNMARTYILESETNGITGPYQSYCLQTSAAGQLIIFEAPAILQQKNGNNAVLVYLGHANTAIINLGGATLDGNRANQTDHATANDVVRTSGVDGIYTFKVRIRNSASAGLKCDDTNDSIHLLPDVENCARNGIMVFGSRNFLIHPKIVNTQDGQFANGIFFTASPSSVTTTDFVFDNVCISPYVEDAGDIGIESGIHCVNTLILGGTVKDSYNQGVIIRDNIKPRVHDIRIQARSGGNTETAITVDSQLFKLNPSDPNAVTNAGGGLISGVIASNLGANGSGLEIEVEGVSTDDNYSEGRGSGVGGSAYNIKASNVRGSNNRSRNIGNHIRLAGNSPLEDVHFNGGTFDSVNAIIKIEQLVTKSSCMDHKGSGSSTPVLFAGAGDVQGLNICGIEDVDNPKRTIPQASKFVTGRNGFYLAGLASQFAFTAILAGLQAAIYQIKTSTGESAIFKADGAAITFLLESTNIGSTGSGKAYRIEIDAGQVILKRYEVIQTINYFVIDRLI